MADIDTAPPEIDDTDDELLLTDAVDDGKGVADDDAPPADAGETDNSTIRAMRAEIRALKREQAERDAAAKRAAIPVVGERPVLDDYEFDAERHAEAVSEWLERKRQAEAASADDSDDDYKQKWQQDLSAFVAGRTELAASDPKADAIIKDVDRAFAPGQMAALVQAFDKDAAIVMRAIGEDAGTMDDLADEANPFKLVIRAERLRAAMQKGSAPVANRPDIDRPLRGKPANLESADKVLASLEAKARQSGDYTDVLAHKRKLRAKSAA